MDYYEIIACGGAKGCPMAILDDKKLVAELGNIIECSDLKKICREKIKGDVKIHQKLKIAISGCVNGCGKHQIVDIGLVGQRKPIIPKDRESSCTTCGKCVKNCREEALKFKEKGEGIYIDYNKCLNCGRCIEWCEEQVFSIDKEGYRIEIGGKLGRHPRFAKELVSFSKQQEAAATIENLIDLYIKNMGEEFERFSEYVERVGVEGILSSIKS